MPTPEAIPQESPPGASPVYFCDPALHDGAYVAADYYVIPPREQQGHGGFDPSFAFPSFAFPSFAACAFHLLHAVREVAAKVDGRTLTVVCVTGCVSQ